MRPQWSEHTGPAENEGRQLWTGSHTTRLQGHAVRLSHPYLWKLLTDRVYQHTCWHAAEHCRVASGSWLRRRRTLPVVPGALASSAKHVAPHSAVERVRCHEVGARWLELCTFIKMIDWIDA